MSKFPIELKGTRAFTLMWADPREVESQAMDQIRSMADLPWMYGIRIMPDVHFGMGATVGSVIAMENAIAPAAVGVDIGCGMAAVRTSLTAGQLPTDLLGLRTAIEEVVPVGFHSHKQPVNPARIGVDSTVLDDLWRRYEKLPFDADYLHRVKCQVGTLGGGNHFIEICVSDEDEVWIMLHSGSRNVGSRIAEHHIAVAKTLPHNQDLANKDMAVFLNDTPEMETYLHDLHWAQQYAFENRKVMLALVQNAMQKWWTGVRNGDPIEFEDPILCHHNYVAEETIDGQKMLVTRKGAIAAHEGEMGIIPGSMGTRSYIVRGLGNPQSYYSASHGAGRVMSRREARRKFSVADLARQTAGVESRKDKGVIDEIPGAYKDIDQVIEDQADLVEVVTAIKQVVVVKG